jgi:hypothetical protein
MKARVKEKRILCPFCNMVSSEIISVRVCTGVDCNVADVRSYNVPLILSCEVYLYILMPMI